MEVSEEDYRLYESGTVDLPFTFLHKCAKVFGIDITVLLEGHSAHLSSYTITRKGKGQATAKEDGIEIQNLAPQFRKKIAEPYWVRYEYNEEQQNKPIHLSKHSGQEFDFVMSGRLKIQIGDNVEYLSEGDSIYYNSSTPHGMIAVDGQDCLFVAVVLPGENADETEIHLCGRPLKADRGGWPYSYHLPESGDSHRTPVFHGAEPAEYPRSHRSGCGDPENVYPQRRLCAH